MIIRIWQLPRVVAHERFNYIKSVLISYITRYLESCQKLHSSIAKTVSPLSAKRIIIMRSLISRRKERRTNCEGGWSEFSWNFLLADREFYVECFLRIRKFPITRVRLHLTDVILNYTDVDILRRTIELTRSEGRTWHEIIVIHNSLMQRLITKRKKMK